MVRRQGIWLSWSRVKRSTNLAHLAKVHSVEMEGPPVGSLALSGAGYGSRKARLIRPTRPVNRMARAIPADAETDPPRAPKITNVDALVKELRKAIHAMFCTVDPSIPSDTAYENYSRQAFRFFTTTNSITPEGFQHKVVRLGLHVPPRLSNELFRRIDHEDLGEIDYATFAQRVFLPEAFYTSEEPSQGAATGSPVKQSGSSDTAKRGPAGSPSSPAAAYNAASSSPRKSALVYEHMPLAELEKCISRNLKDMMPRSTDPARQAFRFFTNSDTITFAEFHRHLGLLQIQLSPPKCRELFVRFDKDRDGMIDFIEFVATLFRPESYLGFDRPSSASSSRNTRHPGDARGGDQEASLTTKQLVATLREKLDQFSAETDRFQQAFRLFGKPSGITLDDLTAAMRHLGLRCSDKQAEEVFDTFDFDKTGDLDVNKFVQGVMLDDHTTSFWLSVKDRQKVDDSRRKLYSMAVQSVQDSWTIADIERMLREKIEQRTSRSSDCFRQAFRIFKKVNGIKPDEFHAALEAIGLALTRVQSDILFRRFDKDGSGDIDLNEFIHGVLPPDYTGISWVAAADEMHRIAAEKKKARAMANPDQYMTEIEMANWSLDEIEMHIRDKIQQFTSRSSDTFRQAYKIFKKSSHVTMDEFRERLLALGFRLTPAQCQGLFKRYDTDNSNDLDLQEFCLKILPPDYTNDGDHWSHSEKYKKERQREKLEYVKRSKNGLIMLPKFIESHRFTRGHYVSRTFEEMQGKSMPTFSRGSEDSSTSRPTTSFAQEEEVRSPTPRPPHTARPPTSCGMERSTLQHLPSPRKGTDINTPTSPRTPCSPRQIRTASAAVTSRSSCPQKGVSVQATPPTSPRVLSPSRPLSPREAANTPLSPSRPSTPRQKALEVYEDEEVEYEKEEYFDDGENGDAPTSGELSRVKQSSRHRHKHGKSGRHHSRHRHGDKQRGSTASQVSVRGPESVTSSTTSAASGGVGTAKHMPQRSHVLLIKRFMQAAGKGPALSASKSSKRLNAARR